MTPSRGPPVPRAPVLTPRVLAFALAFSLVVGLGADGPGNRSPLGVPRFNRIGSRPTGGKLRDFELTGADGALKLNLIQEARMKLVMTSTILSTFPSGTYDPLCPMIIGT